MLKKSITEYFIIAEFVLIAAQTLFTLVIFTKFKLLIATFIESPETAQGFLPIAESISLLILLNFLIAIILAVSINFLSSNRTKY